MSEPASSHAALVAAVGQMQLSRQVAPSFDPATGGASSQPSVRYAGQPAAAGAPAQLPTGGPPAGASLLHAVAQAFPPLSDTTLQGLAHPLRLLFMARHAIGFADSSRARALWHLQCRAFAARKRAFVGYQQSGKGHGARCAAALFAQ